MTIQDSLYTLHASLLTQAKAALATTPEGDIAHAYVSTGEPAYDCEQITVHQITLDKAATSLDGPGPLPMSMRRPSVNQVAMQLTVLRCIRVPGANLRAPAPAKLDLEAQVSMRDQWVVWNYLQRRVDDGILFPSASDKRNGRFGPCIPVTAEGGLAGFTLNVLVELDGYAA